MNLQPPEKIVDMMDGELDIIKIFSTLQGEGPYAGTPAVFIRLAGCNLACLSCDTQYTEGRKLHTVEQIAAEWWRKMCSTKLVVITGGEPFRQKLAPLVRYLIVEYDCTVQIETNGTIYEVEFPYLNNQIRIVCSPKTSVVEDRVKPYVKALKYVLHHKHVDPSDGLPTSVLGRAIRPCRPWYGFKPENVFVQPEDSNDAEENKLNVAAALKSCMDRGFRLSLQLHKQLNLE